LDNVVILLGTLRVNCAFQRDHQRRPAVYRVIARLVTNKTSSAFRVTQTPPASVTFDGRTFDVVVLG
jgi:hypothetical protein